MFLLLSTLGAMMLRARNISTLLTGLFFSLSGEVGAADCRNDWWGSSSQTMTMTMDSPISFALTDYKNEERHFSAKQGRDRSLDIYYLKDAVLIKGYSEAQIEQTNQNELSMMPIATLSLPTTILAMAAPKGPCSVGVKTPFSIQFSDADRLRDRTISSAVGHLFQSAPNEISYELGVSFDPGPPAPYKALVRYSGTLSFAPQEASPTSDADVAGYTVFTPSRPFPVIGSSAIPVVKLGEVRRFLASRQMAPNPALQRDAPPAARP